MEKDASRRLETVLATSALINGLAERSKICMIALRKRIIETRLHCARTDKLDDMNKTDLTARREIKQAESQPDAAQLTGYESPQRRRFLRALAAEERCGD